MSESPAKYGKKQDQPGLGKLVGRRVELVRLLHTTKPERAGRQLLLLMLDDGRWLSFLSSGQFLPLANGTARDIHTLLQQGENAYKLLEMAVANPDEPEH